MPNTSQIADRSRPSSPAVEPEIVLGDLRHEGAFARLYVALHLVWSERHWIFRFVMLGTLLIMATSFLIPNYYESTARLLPPDNRMSSNLGALSALAGNPLAAAALGDTLSMKSPGAMIAAVTRSRSMADRLINIYDLRRVYGVRLMASARKRLESNTFVAEEPKSGVVIITVSDRDPVRAATLTNGYVAQLNQLLADLNTSAAHRERMFLEDRLRTVKLDLDNSAKQLSDFSSKNIAIDMNAQARAMVEGAAQLQGQLIAAEAELRGLEQIYADNNVRVRSTRARIHELNRQLLQMRGKDESSAATADANVPADSTVTDIYPSIRKLPVLGLTYYDLYRRTKIQEALYETLTRQYELAKVQEAKELPSVRVLDEGLVPERKSGPARAIISSLGMIFCFTIAVVVVLLREWWRGLSEEDTRKIVGTRITNSANDWLTRNRALRWSQWRGKVHGDRSDVGSSDI